MAFTVFIKEQSTAGQTNDIISSQDVTFLCLLHTYTKAVLLGLVRSFSLTNFSKNFTRSKSDDTDNCPHVQGTKCILELTEAHVCLWGH